MSEFKCGTGPERIPEPRTTVNKPKPNVYDVRINNGRVEYFDGERWIVYRRVNER